MLVAVIKNINVYFYSIIKGLKCVSALIPEQSDYFFTNIPISMLFSLQLSLKRVSQMDNKTHKPTETVKMATTQFQPP